MSSPSAVPAGDGRTRATPVCTLCVWPLSLHCQCEASDASEGKFLQQMPAMLCTRASPGKHALCMRGITWLLKDVAMQLHDRVCSDNEVRLRCSFPLPRGNLPGLADCCLTGVLCSILETAFVQVFLEC